MQDWSHCYEDRMTGQPRTAREHNGTSPGRNRPKQRRSEIHELIYSGLQGVPGEENVLTNRAWSEMG